MRFLPGGFEKNEKPPFNGLNGLGRFEGRVGRTRRSQKEHALNTSFDAFVSRMARGLALRCGAAASRSACKKNPFVEQTIRFVRVADVVFWWHVLAAAIFRVVGCGGTVVWCAR